MKNLFKLFGIIALVAVIGFSFAACNTDPDEKTIPFHVQQSSTTPENLAVGIYFDVVYNTQEAVIQTLTKEDIVFSDPTIVTLNSIDISDQSVFLRKHTVHKSGTVTVSIKDKDGFTFVSDGNDQITVEQ